VNKEEMNNDQLKQRWNIGLDWYHDNDCSFLTLAKGYLCPVCRKRLEKGNKPTQVFKTVAGCCSKKEGFMTPNMPILASVFRLFLANGNQPLDAEELAEKLNELRGDTHRINPELLIRLLENDRYYGLRPVSEAAQG
jgi:hypothetical protein